MSSLSVTLRFVIPTRERQDFFDHILDGERICLTAMTRLEWKRPELVDYALWHLSEGKAVKDIARDLGVAVASIYRWRDRAGEDELWLHYGK